MTIKTAKGRYSDLWVAIIYPTGGGRYVAKDTVYGYGQTEEEAVNNAKRQLI